MAVKESPSSSWLPLTPARNPLANPTFDADIAGWVAGSSTFAAVFAFEAKVGAPGTAAGQFADVRGLAVDSQNRIWAADDDNERLQRFSAALAHELSVGSAGTADGQFATNDGPWDVAVTSADEVWAVDRGNQRIQQFSSAGAFLRKVGRLIWALQSTHGSLGTGNDNFDTPGQVATDSSGNTYTVDFTNTRIVKRSSSGAYVSHFTPLDSASALIVPRGVAVDGSGNIYVSGNQASTSIFAKYNASFVRQWDTGSLTGVGIPKHIATDSTHIYVAMGNDTIQKRLCSTGALATSWGSAGSGNGQFTTPYGIAYSSTDSLLYVVDQGNSRVQVFTTSGAYQRQWAISASARGIAIDGSGNVLVAEYGSDIVKRYTNTGALIDSFVQLNPDGVAVATGDVVWVSNADDDNLAKWDEAPSSGAGNGQFNLPQSLDVKQSSGRVYVADTGNNRIQYFTSLGVYEGQWAVTGPTALAVNQTSGEVYVLRAASDLVARYGATGTLIGTFGTVGTSAGQFQDPAAIAIHPVTGNVFVTDTTRDKVIEFTAAGVYVREFGTSGSADGQFSDAQGIAFDVSGANLYVSDLTVERIQRFNMSEASRDWDPAIGGVANGSLVVVITGASAADEAQTVTSAWLSLNGKESVEVAAWVRSDNANLTPRLRIIFADAAGTTVATETEANWTPVANTEYTRALAARAPGRATQYKIGLLVYAAAAATGSVWFDDVLPNGNVLIVRDAAGDPGTLKIKVQIPARWV